MPEPIKEEEKKTETPVVPSTTEQTPKVETTTEQDPLKTELDRVQRKSPSKVEKLKFQKRKINQQLRELGEEDEMDDPDDDEDDTKPVTRGELKQMQAQAATKTALDLASEVTNETERELLKFHLENTIKSTGNPQEDFKLAQQLVLAAKNSKILEEQNRKPETKTTPSTPGAPAKIEKNEELTPEELSFMGPPFNLTKEEILKARVK